MAGFEHGPVETKNAESECVESKESEQAHTAARNAQHGLKLFAVYFAVYAGFVLLNAFRPDLMERTPLAGINVAVLYGFGLILGALVMSLVYGWLCRAPAAGDVRQGDSE